MKYRKALTVDEAYRVGWGDLQRGQWVRGFGVRGRFVGLGPRGTVWVVWEGKLNQFSRACARFKVAY